MEFWNGMLDWSAGVECWNGVLEWSAGMECWNGVPEWSAGIDPWTKSINVNLNRVYEKRKMTKLKIYKHRKLNLFELIINYFKRVTLVG